jgi:hypothetical protein
LKNENSHKRNLSKQILKSIDVDITSKRLNLFDVNNYSEIPKLIEILKKHPKTYTFKNKKIKTFHEISPRNNANNKSESNIFSDLKASFICKPLVLARIEDKPLYNLKYKIKKPASIFASPTLTDNSYEITSVNSSKRRLISITNTPKKYK